MPTSILCIETAGDQCSVALGLGGSAQVLIETQGRMHSKKLLSMVEQLLSCADVSLSQLDLLSFSCGPGSFTGLRIASGVTQGLAFAADIPVAPISTLAVLAQAQTAFDQTYVLACIDARLDEVYSGWYQVRSGVVHNVLPDQVLKIGQLVIPSAVQAAGFHAVGDGWKHQQAIDLHLGCEPLRVDVAGPNAENLLPLASAAWFSKSYVDATLALPVYLRDEVHWKKLPGR